MQTSKAFALKTMTDGKVVIITSEAKWFVEGEPVFTSSKFTDFQVGELLLVLFMTEKAGFWSVKHVEVVDNFYSLGFDNPKYDEIRKDLDLRMTTQKSSEASVSGSVNNGFYISPEAKMVFTTANQMSLANPQKATKIIMLGPSGYGKTTLPKLFADVTGRDFLRMNCASVRDSEEWFGYREAVAGSTVFIPSAFIQALTKGNLVVVLDELNRLEPWLHNPLFPLLDDDGKTVIHDQEFKIGPNVIVVATINTGYRYTGTFELDEALSNRFDFNLEVGPMPHNEEVKVLMARTGVSLDTAGSVAKTANTLRAENFNCSTRSTLEICRMIASGLEIREAIEFSVIRRIPLDETGGGYRKTAIDLVNNRHGPFAPRSLTNDIFGYVPPVEEVESAIATNEVTLYLKPEEGKIFKTIQVTRLLQSQNIKGSNTQNLKAAKRVTDQLQAGNGVEVEFEELDNVDGLIAELRNLGVIAHIKLD